MANQSYWWPSAGPQWSDYLTAVGFIGILFGAFWAINELDRRRRERIEIRQCEVAEEALICFHLLVEAISYVRNPFGHSGEGHTRKLGKDESEENRNQNLDSEYVAIERLEAQSEVFLRAASIAPKVKVFFGDEALRFFMEPARARSSIILAVRSLTRLAAIERTLTEKELERWDKAEETKWESAADEDQILKSLHEAAAGLESALTPVLKTRFNDSFRRSSRSKLT